MHTPAHLLPFLAGTFQALCPSDSPELPELGVPRTCMSTLAPTRTRTHPSLAAPVQPEWTWLLAGELEGACLTAWLRVFCASEDGWSMNRFLEAAGGLGPTLLVVRDTGGAVFGAYAPEGWTEHGDFYGDEGLKAFVFQLAPHAAVFRASGHTNSVQWCCRRSSVCSPARLLPCAAMPEAATAASILCKLASQKHSIVFSMHDSVAVVHFTACTA